MKIMIEDFNKKLQEKDDLIKKLGGGQIDSKVEEPPKKKAPKPLPADYIQKAEAPKEVALENRKEEVVETPVDDGFLNGFDDMMSDY